MVVDVICMSFQKMKHGVERMVMMEKLGKHLMRIVVFVKVDCETYTREYVMWKVMNEISMLSQVLK